MAERVFSSSCDHLAWLSSDLIDIPSADTPCNRCQDRSDNWLCLSCKEVLCSRYVNRHMLAHYQKTNHCLVLGYSDLLVWCCACNAFLDAQAISPLRPVYETAVALKYFRTPPLLSKGTPGASQTDSSNQKRSPQTPPTPPVDDSLLHINTQISSLETKIEKLVVNDTKLHSMKNGMDQYKSELSAEIDDLRSDIKESEHSLRALIEEQHEEIRALVVRQHKEMRAELRQSEDRAQEIRALVVRQHKEMRAELRQSEDQARALAERQHNEIMACLRSKFSPPPPQP